MVVTVPDITRTTYHKIKATNTGETTLCFFVLFPLSQEYVNQCHIKSNPNQLTYMEYVDGLKHLYTS
jgi:hypothetical protein